MTAKEYLRIHQKSMYYYNEIKLIIDDLYEIRHDKGMTENYYERILQQDIRFDKYEDEHNEWTNLGKEYGWAGLIEPEYKPNDDEIDKDVAMNVREELIEVVREDKSFGHLFNLLSKDKDNFITQQEIETAICEQETEKVVAEENNTTDKIINTKETISFSKYLTCNDEMKPALLEYLKQTYAGKGGMGKHFAIMVCALEKAELLNDNIQTSKLYHSIKEIFGEVGGERGFIKYYAKNELSQELRRTNYTNKLTHSEIEEHTNRINKKVSELKSS
jgi:hypothetical protein